MKRVLIVVAALVLIAAAIGYGVFRSVGGEGSTELENWVGRCVVGVIESHLTAKVEFDQLDYQAPGTVILDGLKLIGADQTPLVQVKRVQLTLAEVPRLNKPVQIQSITLDAPSLRFDQDVNGALLGWSTLVKPEVLDDGLDAVQSEYRLSEVLVMRRIDINDGQIEYSSGPGSDPMVLRGLTTSLDTAPQPDEPGWYAIKGAMSRLPQLDIQFDGRFNIDTMLLDLAKLTTTMSLEEAQYETLPPQIQSYVRQYKLRGELSAMLSGSLPAMDLAQGHADLDATLSDAFASFGKSIVPIDTVHMRAALADQKLDFIAEAKLLSGAAEARATAKLTDSMDVNASYSATRINLRESLAVTNPDEPLPYDGILNASGKVRTKATSPLESIKGGGSLFVEQGRLVNLPIISDLVRTVSGPFTGKRSKANDEAEVEYRFMPDHLSITKFELISPIVAARGDGKVFYDQRLSLMVNAGPMERVQKGLGAIGDLLGKVTDQLVKYYVGGTIDSPSISVKPLGIGGKG